MADDEEVLPPPPPPIVPQGSDDGDDGDSLPNPPSFLDLRVESNPYDEPGDVPPPVPVDENRHLTSAHDGYADVPGEEPTPIESTRVDYSGAGRLTPNETASADPEGIRNKRLPPKPPNDSPPPPRLPRSPLATSPPATFPDVASHQLTPSSGNPNDESPPPLQPRVVPQPPITPSFPKREPPPLPTEPADSAVFDDEPDGAYDAPTLQPTPTPATAADVSAGFNPGVEDDLVFMEGDFDPAGMAISADEGYLQMAEDEDIDELDYDEILETEALEWIESITNRTSDGYSVSEYLGDGVLLCHVMAKLEPLYLNVKDVSREQTNAAMAGNCELFLVAASRYGCPRKDMFEPEDLFAANNLLKVVDSIHALGERAGEVGFSPSLNNKHRKARKERERIAASKSEPPVMASAQLCDQRSLRLGNKLVEPEHPSPESTAVQATPDRLSPQQKPVGQPNVVTPTASALPSPPSSELSGIMQPPLVPKPSPQQQEMAVPNAAAADRRPSARPSLGSDSNSDGDATSSPPAQTSASTRRQMYNSAPLEAPPQRKSVSNMSRSPAAASPAPLSSSPRLGSSPSGSSPRKGRLTSASSSNGSPAPDRRTSKSGLSRNRPGSAVMKVASQSDFKVILPGVTRTRALTVVYKIVANQPELGKIELYERKGAGKGMPAATIRIKNVNQISVAYNKKRIPSLVIEDDQRGTYSLSPIDSSSVGTVSEWNTMLMNAWMQNSVAADTPQSSGAAHPEVPPVDLGPVTDHLFANAGYGAVFDGSRPLQSLTKEDIVFQADREHAEKTLRHHRQVLGSGASGLYLIHASSKIEGVVLSLYCRGKISHWTFVQEEDVFSSSKGTKYSSLADIVSSYRDNKHEFPCKATRLLLPTPPSK